MKNFSYSYRDKNGAISHGTLKAHSRIDVLRELKVKGYIPLSVTEGIAVNASNKIMPSFSMRTFVFAGLIILAIALTFVFLMRLKKTPPTSKKPSAMIVNKADMSGKRGKGTVKTKEGVSLPVAASKTQAGVEIKAEQIPVVQPEQTTNTTSQKPVEPVLPIKPPNSLRTSTEQLLSIIASTPPGSRVPPLPITPRMAKDFATAMTNTIIIHETDTEKDAVRKEKVAWMKLDVAELVKQGYTPEAIIKALETEHNENASRRTEILKYASELRRAGKDQEYTTFIEEANKELINRGSEPIQPLQFNKVRSEPK